MTLPYVITILVATGDPDGVRVVEKSNWSGQGLVFSRSDLSTAAHRGLSSPGVYVLLGDDPSGEFEGTAHVGEGEDIAKRLASHQRDDTKEFWTTTVVFTSKDTALNKAHIRHLESRLIGLGHDVRRVRITNSTRPAVPPMSAADLAEAEGFLAEMLAIFPVLGVSAFDKPVARQVGAVRYFLSGPDARGEGEDRSDGFLVFAGATARVEETNSLSDPFRRMRARLLATGVLAGDGAVYRLTEDYVFKSPSTAAMTLLSRNANGRTEWKDSAGVSLKEHQALEADQVGQSA